ncbi:GntR family transcriptional regulator YhfZ [Vibrio ezurae]|uniref:HTH gntR-type domain-containing protein n=1 Tax=Vibrio ezurae NBRC 102218 TaxID=1219080 RepID=U3ALT1_9VIBR|nr:GntR family transcriptional regulator YhfZ [Vibrio ezurae]GAD80851.1 hypothetical protein VEZ01S_44_00540 [Vibrio ezurae NBRC 102218]
MANNFIKKHGVALIHISRYLLTVKPHDRLRTIDELSAELGCSVGYIATAIKKIEAEGAVTLDRRGRNGTFISNLDYCQLIRLAEFGNMVCAMPLPYTKHYEGLASGLKAQISVPFYFAHMRGADVRAECLKNGIYDIAIMSRLAAEHYVASGDLDIALELGPNTYVSEHRLICRQGELHNIKRVGVDPSSPDQKLLTETYFKNQNVDIVEAPYNECLELIANNTIDASIWYLSDNERLTSMGLSAASISHVPDCEKASSAVLTVSKKAQHVKILIDHMVDTNNLLQHQNDVVTGKVIPTY